MKVKLDDLALALEFSSSDYDDSCAYLCTESGHIYYDSDATEDVLPDDIFENIKYIEIPSKSDLDLGKPLVLQFVAQYLPLEIDAVHAFFRSRGAYSKFKTLLEKHNALDKWYAYEQSAQKKELLFWCENNGIDVSV